MNDQRTTPAKPPIEWTRAILLILVILIGLACAAPFGWGIYQLLCCNWLSQEVYALALRAALAVMFAGIVLCVLLLLYRFRNEDTSPSLNSGLIVVALGGILTALVLIAARGQLNAPGHSGDSQASSTATK